MVRGLDLFKKWFMDYQDKYILIGGTAASIVMEDAGIPFRATKDLDLVLTVEALSPKFASAFWGFIEAGGYQHRQQSSGKEVFYRFQSPSDTDFPAMIELFSRIPDIIIPRPGLHLTPLHIGDEVASLSAILLEPVYYEFIQSGKMIINGVSIIGADRLIPLKAKAWLDLRTRKSQGIHVDEKDILKHRNDILRLSQILDPAKPITLPVSIADSVRDAFHDLAQETDLNLHNLGIRQASLSQVLEFLYHLFLGDSELLG